MRQLIVLIISAHFLIGCTSIVNTFTNEPFEPDPTKKGIISGLNDKKNEHLYWCKSEKGCT
jgi:hypothetical protein